MRLKEWWNGAEKQFGRSLFVIVAFYVVDFQAQGKDPRHLNYSKQWSNTWAYASEGTPVKRSSTGWK